MANVAQEVVIDGIPVLKEEYIFYYLYSWVF